MAVVNLCICNIASAQCAGSTISFDGVNDYVNTQSTSFMNTTTGSMEAWIYPTAPTASINTIFSKSQAGATIMSWLLLRSDGFLHFEHRDNGGTWRTVVGVTSIPANDWTHVAATWKTNGANVTMKVYVNGCEDGSLTSAFTWSTNTTYSAVIGGWMEQANASNYAFAGYIDEARIWDVERTACDLIKNWKKSVIGSTNLTGCFQFDEGTGTNTSNAVTSNNAILTNGPTWVTPSTAPVFALCGVNYSAGSTITYDGSNDFVDTQDNNTLMYGGNGTVEAWIYPTNPTKSHNVIFSKSIGGGTIETWMLLRTDGKLHFEHRASGGTWYWIDGTSSIPSNNWTHVAATWKTSGSNVIMKIFVNGCKEAELTSTFTWSNNTTYNAIIGGWKEQSFTNTYSFAGKIDEARIWNIDRGCELLTSLDKSIATSYPSSLKGYYKCDENSGTNTVNSVTSTNAVLTNGPTWTASSTAPINPSCNIGACRMMSPALLPENLKKKDLFSVDIFPNPSNSEVNISCVFNASEKVSIGLYDISGKYIKTIHEGYVNSGIYSIKMDTRDIENGIYLCIVKTKSGTSVNKLIIAD